MIELWFEVVFVVKREAVDTRETLFRHLCPNPRTTVRAKLMVLSPSRVSDNLVRHRRSLQEFKSGFQIYEVGRIELRAANVLTIRAITKAGHNRGGIGLKPNFPA